MADTPLRIPIADRNDGEKQMAIPTDDTESLRPPEGASAETVARAAWESSEASDRRARAAGKAAQHAADRAMALDRAVAGLSSQLSAVEQKLGDDIGAVRSDVGALRQLIEDGRTLDARDRQQLRGAFNKLLEAFRELRTQIVDSAQKSGAREELITLPDLEDAVHEHVQEIHDKEELRRARAVKSSLWRLIETILAGAGGIGLWELGKAVVALLQHHG